MVKHTSWSRNELAPTAPATAGIRTLVEIPGMGAIPTPGTIFPTPGTLQNLSYDTKQIVVARTDGGGANGTSAIVEGCSRSRFG